jgi:hypothetical protein
MNTFSPKNAVSLIVKWVVGRVTIVVWCFEVPIYGIAPYCEVATSSAILSTALRGLALSRAKQICRSTSERAMTVSLHMCTAHYSNPSIRCGAVKKSSLNEVVGKLF